MEYNGTLLPERAPNIWGSDWNSRLKLIHSSAALFCLHCGTVSKVKDFKPLAKLAKLECSHERALACRARRHDEM
jgi:hypothetical protein